MAVRGVLATALRGLCAGLLLGVLLGVVVAWFGTDGPAWWVVPVLALQTAFLGLLAGAALSLIRRRRAND